MAEVNEENSRDFFTNKSMKEILESNEGFMKNKKQMKSSIVRKNSQELKDDQS